MTRIVEMSAMALGGSALFGMSFLGFAAASGVPMHEVAVVGGLFEAPEGDPQESRGHATYAPGERAPLDAAQQVVTAQQGVLSAFELPPEFSAQELHLLIDEVKSRQVAQDVRTKALDERELSLEERETVLEDRLATLNGMKLALEGLERELDLREQEVVVAEGAKAARKESAWDATAKLFVQGDLDDQAARLQQFPPHEAAEILVRLKTDRASSLLAALQPPERWREYQDAFSAHVK